MVFVNDVTKSDNSATRFQKKLYELIKKYDDARWRQGLKVLEPKFIQMNNHQLFNFGPRLINIDGKHSTWDRKTTKMEILGLPVIWTDYTNRHKAYILDKNFEKIETMVIK